MGLFNIFTGKEDGAKKVVEVEKKKRNYLNERDGIRYPINETVAGTFGKIIEISKTGLKILKSAPQLIDTPEITFQLAGRDLRCRVIWQDEKLLGAEISGGFDDIGFITKNIKRIKDATFKPLKRVSDEAIIGFLEKDIFSNVINLMAEVESPQTNVQRLRTYMVKVPGLKETIAHEAGIPEREGGYELKDIDFAIKRLGLDAIRQLSSKYVKENGDKLEPPKSDMIETQKILRAVFFPKLSPFFGFKDDHGFANAILTLETKGIDILTQKSEIDIRELYMTPSRIFCEMSRFCERLYFGKDLVTVNRIYMNNVKRNMGSLFDAYIYANVTKNIHYKLEPDVKLYTSKMILNLSFLIYLMYMIAEAFIEKDKFAADILKNRLKRTGMDDDKLEIFLAKNINEVISIIRDLGRKSSIKENVLQTASFKLRDFIPKELHYEKLLGAFSEFKTLKRMVIRYEDETYTHFILGKIINTIEFDLNAKVYCVLPCENLAREEFQPEQFSFFGLLIFKNIDQLHKSLLRSFVKLWNNFDGHIIVTFSSYSLMDYNMRDLYVLLRKHMVDFPSFFEDEKIYRRMIEHTVEYIRPYMSGVEIEQDKYFGDVYTMNNIRGSELMQKDWKNDSEMSPPKKEGTSSRFRYKKD